MITIEIEYPSLAEAYERGPADIFERARAESLRLIEAPTYCERDGKGVASVAAEEPSALAAAARDYANLAAALGAAASPTQPAPVGSDNPDTTENG